MEKTLNKKINRQVFNEAVYTIALVCTNDGHIIEKSIKDISRVLKNKYQYYEIVIIDNGSIDDSVAIIKKLQRKISNIRLLTLSQRYGMEIAISAALDTSLGDFVIVIDPYKNPAKIIPLLIEKGQSGSDVVVVKGTNKRYKNRIEKILRLWFYRIISKELGYTISTLETYDRLLSRRAVNSLIKIKNKSRYLKYFSALVGFKQDSIIYKSRINKSKYQDKANLVKLINDGWKVLISQTNLPLRVATSFGIVASLLNILFLIYVVIVSLVKKKIIEGWITTSIMNSTMFLILFMILTVVAEYLAKLLDEIKDQPLYFISDEYHSKTLDINEKRINVK